MITEMVLKKARKSRILPEGTERKQQQFFAEFGSQYWEISCTFQISRDPPGCYLGGYWHGKTSDITIIIRIYFLWPRLIFPRATKQTFWHNSIWSCFVFPSILLLI